MKSSRGDNVDKVTKPSRRRQKYFAAIDFKSFYASVECVERKLDPMTTNLVVADFTRTDGTICLAVSPSLKKLGLPGRCRLFEVKAKAREYKFETGEDLEYIVAPPRMKKYLDYSKKVYRKVFLSYVAEEDIFRYSIDEVFLDISSYLKFSGKSPEEFVRDVLKRIYRETGLVATAGIGTNLYLAKVAMDILAKKVEPDSHGVRLASLDEEKFKRELWNHRPLTDFWRIGRATAKKLEKFSLFTMGDLARVALKDEEFFYKMFGVDAELFIDHIWGIEPTELKDVKRFKPSTNSLSQGQVLGEAVPHRIGRLLTAEMADGLALEVVRGNFLTNLITLDVIYEDREYGEMRTHGSNHPLDRDGKVVFTCSSKLLIHRTTDLYDRITDSRRKVKWIYLSFGNLIKTGDVKRKSKDKQLDLFGKRESEEEIFKKNLKEANLSRAVDKIKQRYGSNSISKAMSFEKGANARKRNRMIGGHNA
ncbi:DNA methylase [Candidatus Saccharibacteria bacterium]|nr:DNA methylase [Candidatus Saccharibacteria bacterium]